MSVSKVIESILCALATATIYLISAMVLFGLTLIVLTLCAEILAAVFAPKRKHDAVPPAERWPRVAVLVPAHNESVGIVPTLVDAKSQLRAADQLLVVADNCTDDTAQVARAQGATVCERHDPDRRGKGYALSAGVAHLTSDPPDVVIIIDADCRISANAIPRLAAKCAYSGRPAQGNYMMRAPPSSTLSYNVAAFAWRVKNFVRPLGLSVLGLPCQLTGSGMALPWSAIRSVNLASGNIVEDMALGIELAMRDEPALYCPEAEVVSTFPTTNKALQTQRRRWEQGHFRTILVSAAPLIIKGISRRNVEQIALGLDLTIPPLSALFFLISGALVMCLMLRWFGYSIALAYVAAADTTALLLAVAVAWRVYGQDTLPASALPRIAPYLINKLRVYQSILMSKGAAQWTRTDRK